MERDYRVTRSWIEFAGRRERLCLARRPWLLAVALAASPILLGGCPDKRLRDPDKHQTVEADRQRQGEAFGGEQCSSVRPQTEPDLMAWDPGSRLKLSSRSSNGVVAVRYEAEGCNVSLEIVDCRGDGTYEFHPYSANESKTAHNERELYAELPLGASRLGAKVKGGKALRTDYMLAGVNRLGLLEAYPAGKLKGTGCERATHVIEAIYIGGFAMVTDDANAIDIGARVFGVGAGGSSSQTRMTLAEEGEAEACGRSQKEAIKLSQCSVPLRIGLIPIEGKSSEGCPLGSDWDGTGCVAKKVVTETVCPAGSELKGDQCVAAVKSDCPKGTSYKAGEGCVAAFQKSCPKGSSWVDGEGCVAKAVCPAGSKLQGGQCVAAVSKDCPKGTSFVEGTGCVAKQAGGDSSAGGGSKAQEGSGSTAGMVLIEGGSFTSKDGQTRSIVAYWLGKTEVTATEYRACVQAGKCEARTTSYYSGADQSGEWCNYGVSGKGKHPMNCVSWQDAVNYCGWTGGRLPDEWEWEWAARGRDEGRTYAWGGGAPSSSSACFDRLKTKEGTCEVTAPAGGASRDGLLGMSGNVWEWTASWYDGTQTARVLRGGSWDFGNAGFLRADYRGSSDPSGRSSGRGFRCARTR